MRIGLFFKYDREVVNGSKIREIPDLWGRVDRYENNSKDDFVCTRRFNKSLTNNYVKLTML